jgi:predicted DsbA family dithiol-disulfide isomerase
MRVEIWSDVVCPWCYVGTRRFSAAVDRFLAGPGGGAGGPLDVRYRAFELDTSVPPGGLDLADYLARKFGGRAALDRVHGRLAQAGADAGIDFRWDGKRRVNTFDAHRLAAWSEEVGGPPTRADVEQRLFRAYFTGNVNVSDHGVLAGLAADAGLGRAAAAEALATDAGADQVRAEETQAAELGITAVPTFVFEGRWAVPGAQDVDTFVQVLQRAAERLVPAPPSDQ